VRSHGRRPNVLDGAGRDSLRGRYFEFAGQSGQPEEHSAGDIPGINCQVTSPEISLSIFAER